MARYSFIDQQKLDDPSADPAPPAQNPPASFDASPAGTPGAAPAPKSSSGPSGRFVDIQRMLYANKGQGQRMAQGAIDTASQLATSAQQQLRGAQQAYQTQAQAGTPKAFSAYTPPPVQSAAAAPRAAAPAMSSWTGAAPVAQQAGGWGGFASKAPAATSANQTLPGQRATTTQNTVAPTPEQAQAAVDARYTGPHSLQDTQGVDPAALSASFQNAYQAGQALGTSPSALLHQSGGIGALNDLLTHNEAGGDLRAAKAKFSGIRDQLTSALGDTSAATAGANSAAATQAAGKAEIARQAQETADETQRQTDDANAQFSADQERDNAYQSAGRNVASLNGFLRTLGLPGSVNGFNGTIDGVPVHDWWNAHWPEIQSAAKKQGYKF
jgi:hypothetical protein